MSNGASMAGCSFLEGSDACSAPTQLMHSPKLLMPIFLSFFWPWCRIPGLAGTAMGSRLPRFCIPATWIRPEGPAQFSVDQKLAHLDPAYRTALAVCAILNIAMFFIEGTVGVWIGSAALFADAGDFLEDAAV